jgi:TonB family protein
MNNTEAWKTWEGRTVDGKFPLRRWLGGSDHSAVFLTDLGGSQKAVIKLIAASLNADRQLSRWAVAAKLSHPHLIRLFEMGRCRFDGTPLLYLVMEYAEEDLSQIIPQRPLTPAEVGDMLPPVLETLSYLHSKGLVHSRIRPSNILAVADQLKLSTDGVSSRGESDEKPTSLTIYDAPEVASGEIFPAIDVWSLGVTLVVALTQNPPAIRSREQAKEQNEQKDPVVPETVPEPFRSIARESLHRQVKQRCTIADIRAWRPPQQPTPVPVAAPESTTKSSRFRWRIAVPVALALVAVVVIVGQKLLAPHDVSPAAQPATQPEPAQSEHSKPAAVVPADVPHSAAPIPQPANDQKIGSVTESDGIHQVIPDVPRSASNTITGRIKVKVRVEVDASGKVTNATLTTPGPSKYFANLALNAAKKWEFAPPQSNGQPTASTWTLLFEFSKTSTKAFPSREHR